MRYSIVYALTRPDAGEKISVGLVTLGEDIVKYTYSRRKLDIAASLLSKACGEVLVRIVETFEENAVKGRSVDEMIRELNYLSRYSNNLFTVSAPRTVDVEWSEEQADALAREYVG